jgi:ABC-type siderophore export system fused ATPase/permease subunit
MTDDLHMADLLGETPKAPDPGFRIDVLARVGGRARRRAALERAWKQIVVFTLIGAVFPVAQALGFTWQNAQPLVLAGTVLAFAYLFAALTIQGPGPLLARSRAMLRRV